MKKTILFACIAMLALACSEPVKPTKVEGEKSFYGSDISIENPVSVTQLLKKMNSLDTLADVIVEGSIVSTCAVKGCWMTIDNGSDDPLRVKFKDYGFFVPTEGAEGKKAVFKGKAFTDVVSVDSQHHYIDDSDATDEEKEKLKAKITDPKKVISFEATGVVIEGMSAPAVE